MFFSRSYDETMALLIETRNYIAYSDKREIRALPPLSRLRATHEAMRVTSRLTQVMAWLLAQRAVFAGELTTEQLASEAYALAGHDICLDTTASDDEDLPRGLRSLLERSYDLYVRTARLDEMVRAAVA
jgi:regulator of CtrA degradation